MSLSKKLLWGGLGWAMGGPVGAILGVAFAAITDKMQQPQRRGTTYRRSPIPRTTSVDFMASLLVLMADVMKADDKKLKSELDYVKSFLSQQFDDEDTKNYILLFREILKQNYSLKQVSLQIQRSMDHPSRLELIHMLFGLSTADGHIHPKEVERIELIARYLNINPNDLSSIKAMFVKSTTSAYEILEIDKFATNDEVKKAFRKMAKKYHPDKVTHLGEELQNSAEEKFKKVNKAYKEIKLERGLL
jgi:DnaJ like chaperone protein